MRGLLHIGETNYSGGRAGDQPSIGLSADLERLGFKKQSDKLSLAKQGYLPDFGIMAEYIEIGDGTTNLSNDGEDAWMVGLNVKVPLWFWNSSEWCSFTQASARAQVPLLKRSLRSMRNEDFSGTTNLSTTVKRFLGTILTSIKHEQNKGAPWGSFPLPKSMIT